MMTNGNCLGSLTKDPGGNPMLPGSDASLAEGFTSFSWDKIETLYKSLNP